MFIKILTNNYSRQWTFLLDSFKRSQLVIRRHQGASSRRIICPGFCNSMGVFYSPINGIKIQNLEKESGSFRPCVVSAGSFNPESLRPSFGYVALIGGSFRPDL